MPGTTAAPAGRLDLHYRELSDGCALYDPASAEVHVLNRTAALVWTACDGVLTPEEIACLAAETFEVELERARADVERALADLRARRLVEP